MRLVEGFDIKPASAAKEGPEKSRSCSVKIQMDKHKEVSKVKKKTLKRKKLKVLYIWSKLSPQCTKQTGFKRFKTALNLDVILIFEAWNGLHRVQPVGCRFSIIF